ncbi:MAG TPA: ABC transporter permease [Actinomadura sp.]|nr:ABC transporter permease [Actinomadura sp.]
MIEPTLSTVNAPAGAGDRRTGPRRGRLRSPGRARFVRGLIGVLVLLLIGEAVGRAGIVDRSFLPPTSTVLARAAGLLADGGFLQDIAATLLAWGSGLLIAAVIAVPLGLALGSLPIVNSAVRVLIEFLRPIPGVALIPLALLLIPDQAQMVRFVVAYAAIWPIMVNTVYAVGDVDPVARDMARCFGLGGFAVLTRISLPSVAPFIATGLRLASSIALVVTIATELMAGGGEHGIGMFVLQASGGIDTADVVFAAVGVAGVLGYVLDMVMRTAEHRIFRWHFERQGGPA